MIDNTRYIKIDDWYFEIKMVKAIKVDEFGQPYSAVANCNINGDQMYIDGLLTKDDEKFSKDDVNAFLKFCQKLGIESVSYHRMKDGQAVLKHMKQDEQDSIKIA
ncbi:hypothetical protein LP316_06580 [Thalassotalea sp. LPB0316]|uniref:hypothetical protein n=1 Tax=Thalassotalea sp. LPB0316 TaxID=2769490 RepID=UPI001867A6AF|nr:hypothetical protein [Thalassotalea sp. LPB0316]QOL26952.1 hypothetical protein LP316_06580 [Thalassotalea sp. LPB0316]